MVFSSLTFLFIFLPILCLVYFIIPNKFIKTKNIILLIFSLVFYAWGEPKYIILMLLTVLISYIFGLLINKITHKKIRLFTFIIAIILIVSSLIYFKYTNFLITNINNLFKINISIKNIVLPIGISFYTFQILSYIIDLYRNKIKVQKNFFDLALYISFFPQLIAGPIVKYETIEEQLEKREITINKIETGIERFIIGLGKKIIIANNMALIADAVFNSTELNSFSFPIIILGTLAYTFQIYFDFSGYSDMAIGLGQIFGFEFLENFNYPYMATSITDFWKRWHISLTTFFREYVYIPLGGNRVSKKRWLLNMTIVWLLTGFWHGAAWTFISWGLYYLILLILEKTILKNIIPKIPEFIRLLVTFVLVSFGWIIFRVNTTADLLVVIKSIFSNPTISFIEFINLNSQVIQAFPYLVMAVLFSTNIYKRMEIKFKDNLIFDLLKKLILLGILIISISFLVSSMYNPFIYFRF